MHFYHIVFFYFRQHYIFYYIKLNTEPSSYTSLRKEGWGPPFRCFFAKYSFKRGLNLFVILSSAGGGESLTPTLFNKLT